jgi:hypothetical protein
MADSSNRYPENASGAWYVDDQCIDCDLCRETAPSNFIRNEDAGHGRLPGRGDRVRRGVALFPGRNFPATIRP